MMKGITVKKWLLGIFVLLTTTLMGTSCIMGNDELPDCPPNFEKEALQVTANAFCNDKRIDWEEDSRIGVYLINNEKNSLLQDSTGAPYLFKDKDANIFSPQWISDNFVLTRPVYGITYDAIGIYPYGVSLTDTKSLSISIQDQKKPEMLDIFTAHRTKGITYNTDTIHLDLYRRMSRFLFNLKLTEVNADKSETAADEKLAGATILVDGLPTTGRFALDDDELETSQVQTFQSYMATNGKTGQAIVFPGITKQEVRLQISLPQCPDTLYSFVLDKDLELEACRSYGLDLYLKHIIHPNINQYNIKYRYEGSANKNNVNVNRGSSPVTWGEGDIIRVDENSNFTFSYESDLTVSVRTEDGETLSMASGKPYTLTQINKDITLIISAEEPKPDPDPDPEVKTHKVTYIFQGDANKNNVSVYKNGMTAAWAKEETIVVEDKKDFSFGFRSDLDVTVKVDGKNVQMISGKAYTIPEVTKDIVIVISAEIPVPPAPNRYIVKYIREGKHAQENITVTKGKGQNSFEAWEEKESITVLQGSSFTFKQEKLCTDCTVTTKVKDAALSIGTDGSYTFTNIKENITIIISTDMHHVTYVFDETEEQVKSMVDVKQNGSEWALPIVKMVKTGDDFSFDCGIKAVNKEIARIVYVKENGRDVPVLTDTYTLADIRSDKEIHIRAVRTHTVYYQFEAGSAKPDGFNIAGKGNETVNSWTEGNTHKIIVDAGDNFIFSMNKDLTVTSTGQQFPASTTGGLGYQYTATNVQNDIIITLKTDKPYVSFTMPAGVTCDKNSDFVISGTTFSFKPQYPADKPENRYLLKVGYKKNSESSFTPLEVSNNGFFTIPYSITEDTDINITIVRKPADIKITATIKDWTELKTVPGGVIYPD